MIDLVYTSHNRLAYTQASFEALLLNTNWNLVSRLYIQDDNSEDGTFQYLLDRFKAEPPCQARIAQRNFGGPVAALNDALNECGKDVVAKIDNDVIVCPGWLEHMLGVLQANPVIDALGMEPGFGDHVAPLDKPRYPLRARWIGGIFLARASIFKTRPVMNDRWFGMTHFWRKHTTAWITPALPCFLLDHIPVEPWVSLAKEYVAKGWARPWEEYFEAPSPYWSWWVEQQVVA